MQLFIQFIRLRQLRQTFDFQVPEVSNHHFFRIEGKFKLNFFIQKNLVEFVCITNADFLDLFIFL